MSVDWKGVGQAIQAARKARRPKVSQTDVGEALGLTQGAISKIERGEPTTTPTLDAICEFLGLELFVEVKTRGGFTDGSPNHLPEAADVLEALRILPSTERQVVRDLLQAMPHMPSELKAGLMAQFKLYADNYGVESTETSSSSV